MQQDIRGFLACALVFVMAATTASASQSVGNESCHVWEKVEIALYAQNQYENPYTDVMVWVDLKGPGFEKRCYGFWDGGDTFRVRVTVCSRNSSV